MFGISTSEVRKIIAIIYGGKKIIMSEDLKCSFSSNRVSDQIYFYSEFNRTPTADEVAVMPSVNLSRGGTRMYRLDNLNLHNGTGATWTNRNDGQHSEKQEAAYVQRVTKDIEAAWKSFKATITAKAVEAAKPKDTAKTVFFFGNGD